MEGFPEGSLGEGWVPILGEVDASHIGNLLCSAPDAPVFLASEGGDIDVARSLIDIIRARPRRVLAAGVCASAALPILAAGSPSHCLPITKFVHHEPMSEGSGRRGDLQVHDDDMRIWFEWCNRFLGKRTKKTRHWWARLGSGAGSLFSSDEAREWGLVDKVVRGL
jgi:ATP-dependent protease ClpP protease subunit